MSVSYDCDSLKVQLGQRRISDFKVGSGIPKFWNSWVGEKNKMKYWSVYICDRNCVYDNVCTCTSSMSAYLSVSLPASVPGSVPRPVRRIEDSEKLRSAVSQCWLSKELTGAGERAVGGPEPCTIQASFRRSETTGAKNHKVLCDSRTREYHTHLAQELT